MITKDFLNVKQNNSSEQVNGRTQCEILSGMLNEQSRKDTNRIWNTDENNDWFFFQISELKISVCRVSWDNVLSTTHITFVLWIIS